MMKPLKTNPKANENTAQSSLSDDKADQKAKTIILIKNTLQLALGLLIILLFLSIAKVIVSYFQSTFPASILGMLLLFLALSLGVIKLSWIEFTGNLVLKYLALLFIPVGVGLINYFDLVTEHWLVIVFSLFFTTLFTLFMVGHCYQWLAKEKK
ncbi:CidA/LrgA family protein [Psychromonas sp.]|nr:CidA/LrgA family protein [Psychromonas sp.]